MTPTDSVEQIVRRAWCEVLRCADALPDDNFFASGGHSFGAVELMGKVEQGLPVRFPFEAFLLDATLRSLVKQCEAQITAADATGPTEVGTAR